VERPARDWLATVKAELDAIEAGLARRDLREAELGAARARLDPLKGALQAIAGELEPRLETARARLEQLGPKPDEKGAGESPNGARERSARETAQREIDETLRLARALDVQADQIASSLADRRRALFQNALFERSSGVLSPWLWSAVIEAAPRDVAAVRTILSDALSRIRSRLDGGNLAVLALAALAFVLLVGPVRRAAGRFSWRDPELAAPPPYRRARAAIVHVLKSALLAAGTAYLLVTALDVTALLPDRLFSVATTLIAGIAAWTFVRSLAEAYLSPGLSAWRIVKLDDLWALRIAQISSAAVLVLVAGKTLEGANQAISSGLPLTVATRGVFALLFVAQVWRGLRGLDHPDPSAGDEACFGPYVPPARAYAGAARALVVIGCATILIAVLAGYAAFASFLADQLVWIGVVWTSTRLLLALADAFVGRILADQGRLARSLVQSVGMRRRSVEQFAVVASGILRLALGIVAVFIIAAPWGVESGDILASLRAAVFGFRIGDITISLSSLVAAVGVFALAILGTRAAQGWLDDKFLPRTELDAGIRNSIKTGTGYIGTALGAGLAISSLGLSLERLALVAGALSVGIGFGLQSVVNNFVSGLILLWERPIRVGDWILVGEEQGHVRRINVRSTEIETFDRSTVIVPNSNLVSGIVKNRVHTDRTGRVLLAIGVPREADPEAAAGLLRRVAAAHAEVMAEPKPAVLFKRIGETSLDFELICFVAEVEAGARVSSDLNFAVHRALKEAGIAHAPPPHEVQAEGMRRIGEALDALAGRAGEGAGLVSDAPRSQARA